MTIRFVNIGEGWQVKSGPSREELFDALRLFDELRRVKFDLEHAIDDPDARGNPNRHNFEARVVGIAAEDGSGHRWLLDVFFFGVRNQLDLVSQGSSHLSYDDKSRTGNVLR